MLHQRAPARYRYTEPCRVYAHAPEGQAGGRPLVRVAKPHMRPSTRVRSRTCALWWQPAAGDPGAGEGTRLQVQLCTFVSPMRVAALVPARSSTRFVGVTVAVGDERLRAWLRRLEREVLWQVSSNADEWYPWSAGCGQWSVGNRARKLSETETALTLRFVPGESALYEPGAARGEYARVPISRLQRGDLVVPIVSPSAALVSTGERTVTVHYLVLDLLRWQPVVASWHQAHLAATGKAEARGADLGDCSVCLGALDGERERPRGDPMGVVQLLSCAHRFHFSCIVQWRRMKATCPLCRAPVGVYRSVPSDVVARF